MVELKKAINIQNINNVNSLGEILKNRAELQPNLKIFNFLNTSTDEISSLTNFELHTSACAISQMLTKTLKKGDRALLIFNTGLDFIKYFFACIYAGIVAVPIVAPNFKINDYELKRIVSIIQDAGITAILTTSTLESLLNPKLQAINSITWITNANFIQQDSLKNLILNEQNKEDLAFLQYTSGSTGAPKGVMISHGNILHNSALIEKNFGNNANSKLVSWLPFYHDMGLIGTLIQSIYVGFEVLFLSPAAFLQKPFKWLETISNFKATVSGAPNFAYDLCIDRVSEEELSRLDLSSWKVAFNGAEPIRSDTLTAFSKKFSVCGFKSEAFCPCYGLAEATLFVSCFDQSNDKGIKYFDKRLLSQNTVVSCTYDAENCVKLVSCGIPAEQIEIKVVEPETLNVCSEGKVGEIWIASDSVAKGYWGITDLSEKTFRNKINGHKEFLRTGDLGFVYQKELFITGRLKDVIIIGGVNYYPQDIEEISSQTFGIRKSCVAAFSQPINGEEKLIILAEVERSILRKKTKAIPINQNLEDINGLSVLERCSKIVNNIKKNISKIIKIDPYDIVLIKTATIPKTSSGKIKRSYCRKLYSDEKLEIITSLLQTHKVAREQYGKSYNKKISMTKKIEEINLWLSEEFDKLLHNFSCEKFYFNRLSLIKENSEILNNFIENIKSNFNIKLNALDFVSIDSIENLSFFLKKELDLHQEMIDFLEEKISRIIKVRREDIICVEPISSYGMTSLGASMLIAQIEKDKNIQINIAELFHNMNIVNLAAVIIEASKAKCDKKQTEPVIESIEI